MAAGNGNKSDLDFTADLFRAADKLRGNLEPSEYKHVALGLIFLKYISDAFEAQRTKLAADEHADPEDPEEYLAESVFWVPKEARWSFLRANAKRPEIGKLIDEAMEAIEKAPSNEGLKGVLPKNYARPTLNKTMLGELIDLFSNIGMHDSTDRAKDLLGRVYEYFLSGFASSEGKRGGEFFTPRSVVRTPSRCWSLTKAASMIPAAARAACSSSPKSLLRSMAGGGRTSPFMGRRSTTQPGDWPK